jgi:hypothetical protein
VASTFFSFENAEQEKKRRKQYDRAGYERISQQPERNLPGQRALKMVMSEADRRLIAPAGELRPT